MHILKESEKGRIITLKVEFDTALLKVIITICNFSEAHFSFDNLLAKCISLDFRLIKESLLFRLEFSAHLHQVDGVGHNILCFLYHRQIHHAYLNAAGLALNAL